LYTCVPLMMTVWAGRFTPHASVAVDTSTYKHTVGGTGGEGTHVAYE
jgi:hypothetical protein